MTSHTQRRRRSPSGEIFLGALMATGTGNALRDVSFVRKFEGLFNPRHAPIGPITERQRGNDNCKD